MTPKNHSAIPGQTLKLSQWSLLLERFTHGAPAAHRSHTKSSPWRANDNFKLIFLNCAMDFVEKERMLVANVVGGELLARERKLLRGRFTHHTLQLSCFRISTIRVLSYTSNRSIEDISTSSWDSSGEKNTKAFRFQTP